MYTHKLTHPCKSQYRGFKNTPQVDLEEMQSDLSLKDRLGQLLEAARPITRQDIFICCMKFINKDDSTLTDVRMDDTND